jgi:hypothetical protein
MHYLKCRKGQGGDTMIKLLIFAIIAVIALALAKSYFQASTMQVEETIETVYPTTATGTTTYIEVGANSDYLRLPFS